MKQFEYTIRDEIGIHARPAGWLAKKAKEYSSTITVTKGEKSAVATKLIALMGMGIKCGDTVTVTVDGADETEAFADIKSFFESNL